MRFLVVDDDRYLARQIKQKFNNHICDLSFNPQDGLFTARTQSYDLVIIDLRFKQESGLYLIQKIRKDKLNFPILIISGCSNCRDIAQGLNRGADDYVTKPFSWIELRARINALLRRPKQYADNVLKVGSLTLNLNSWQISYLKQPLQLSRKQKLILACLIRNSKRIVTRSILISQVWQKSYVSRSAIDSQISLLRKSVKKQIGVNIIQTVYGFGYQLKSDLN